jgi:hypothetical protein
MCVQIDQPWRDDQTAHIDDIGAVARQVRPDRRNVAAAERDIGDLVARIRRIDDPAASENEIRHASAPVGPERAYTRVMSGKSRRCARRGLALPPKVPRWIAVSPKTAIAPRLAAGSAADRIVLDG